MKCFDFSKHQVAEAYDRGLETYYKAVYSGRKECKRSEKDGRLLNIEGMIGEIACRDFLGMEQCATTKQYDFIDGVDKVDIKTVSQDHHRLQCPRKFGVDNEGLQLSHFHKRDEYLQLYADVFILVQIPPIGLGLPDSIRVSFRGWCERNDLIDFANYGAGSCKRSYWLENDKLRPIEEYQNRSKESLFSIAFNNAVMSGLRT